MSVLSRARNFLLSLAIVPLLATVAALLVLAGAPARLLRRRSGSSTCFPSGTVTASIVVAAGTDPQRLEICLRSIADALRADGQDHEVIVVGEEGYGLEEVSTRAWATSRFLPSRGKGLNGSFERGISASSNGVVVLLSDRVTVSKDFLRPILTCFQDHRVFAVSLGIESAGSGDAPSTAGKTRGEIRNGELRLWHTPSSHQEGGIQPVLWAPRDACAYRKAGFLELGGFDPLFSTAEVADADLGLRAWRRGWKVILEPGSVGSIAITSDSPDALPADLVERDRILLVWKNVASGKRLFQSQLSLAARLLGDAAAGQLNLRPLRYALSGLLLVLRRRAAPSPAPELPDEDLFRISSHRYFLTRHQTQAERTGETEGGRTGKLGAAAHALLAVLGNQHPSRSAPLRILLVCPQLPYPPTHGAAVRMWNLTKMLASRHQVDLLSFYEPNISPQEVAASLQMLRQHCNLVRAVARKPFSLRPSLADRTIHVEQFDCPEMREALLDMVDQRGYDIVQFDKTEMGQYALLRPASVQVLVEHVVFYHAYRRQFLVRGRASVSHLIDYLKLRRYELDICRSFDGVITMSGVDARFLRHRLPSHPCIAEIPNGVDTDYYFYAPSMPENHDLLFIGSFDHSPNVEGLRFFLREVFPLVKSSVPDARLFIVGPGPYHTVGEVASEPSAIATGLVEDTRPHLHGCSVFVAPILAGSGTRLKILEAMSAGIPVVSTSVGIEGIDALGESHLLVADTPRAFADSVVRLLHSPKLREQLRSNARSLVESSYEWQTIGERLEGVYRRLLQARNSQ